MKAKKMGHNYITEKQEAYCQYRADGKTKTDSYRLAGYKLSNPDQIAVEAHNLEKNPKIALRIKEIKKERAEESKPERKRAESALMNNVDRSADWFWKYDEEEEKWRPRKPWELSQKAWNCVKRITKTGYELYPMPEVVSQLSKMNGWDAPIEHNINSTSVGELRFGFDDDDYEEGEIR